MYDEAFLARRGQQRWHTRMTALCLTVVLSLLGTNAQHLANAQETSTTVAPATLMGRVVAVGIPGAGALSPVGAFHPGGPIHDKPDFTAFTRPGAVLDPTRLLVASSSNFGAPLAQPNRPPGAILSLDARTATPLIIPPTFASSDGQAAALEGCVQLLTANSPAFINRLGNPQAVTGALAPVSDPRGISLNNAFGRPWFANAPAGLHGAGVESVVDPDGRPFVGAPNKAAGGVFTGTLANRQTQQVPGALTHGTVGNALLGKSPDGSGRAVFAVALADGSLVQVHVEHGVDGLALGIPAGVNMTSIRNSPPLFGSGLIDALPDDVILAGAVPRGHGVHGRPHLVRDAQGRERVGRFGWKADTATLLQFVADAFRNELGLTNPLAPLDLLPVAHNHSQRCLGEADTPEDDGATIVAMTTYLASLPPPTASASLTAAAQIFMTVGCAACHTPSLPLGDHQVVLYSDLLLHNLGPDLDDKVIQGQATGPDWRTTPLWGLGTRPRLAARWSGPHHCSRHHGPWGRSGQRCAPLSSAVEHRARHPARLPSVAVKTYVCTSAKENAVFEALALAVGSTACRRPLLVKKSPAEAGTTNP